MKFSLEEKLAVVHTLDLIIQVDGVVHQDELSFLNRLMTVLDFDTNFILQSRTIADTQVHSILKQMPEQKKENLAIILNELAAADGLVHQKETDFLLAIFKATGIGTTMKKNLHAAQPSEIESAN